MLETLETRLALSTVSGSNAIREQFELADPGADIPISFQAKLFQSKPRGGQVLLGLQSRDSGGGFVPGSLRVRPSRGASAGISLGPDRAILRYRPGTLATARVNSRAGDATRVSVVTWLVGDADGDGSVKSADIAAIRALRGQRVGQASYRLEADSDRDGRITPRDVNLARLNLGAATDVQPISFLAHTDAFDDRLLTALTEDGKQIEFLVERSEIGAATRISGIREFQQDGSFRTILMDNQFRPTSISDSSGVHIGLEWLEDGSIRWTANIPGAPEPIVAITSGNEPATAMAQVNATKAASTIQAASGTISPAVSFEPDLEIYGRRPIRVHVTDMMNNPVTEAEAEVVIEYEVVGTGRKHLIGADPDPASGPGYYQVVLPFLTARAHERDLYQEIIKFVNDPIIDMIMTATCEFTTKMGGAFVLETGIVTLAALAYTRGGPGAAAAVTIAGEAALASLLFYCYTIGQQLAGGPLIPGSPSGKDVLGKFVKERYADLPDLETSARVIVYYDPVDGNSAIIRSSPFDPRLDQIDWDRVDVSVRVVDEPPPVFDNGLFITPGPVKFQAGAFHQFEGATWEGHLNGSWSVSDRSYVTKPDGTRSLHSFRLTFQIGDVFLPNIDPGKHKLTGAPGDGEPLRLFEGKTTIVHTLTDTFGTGQFRADTPLTNLGMYPFIRGYVDGDTVRLNVQAEKIEGDLWDLVSFPGFGIEFRI